jgi:uroporphyrinogen decarboxylase
MNPATPERVSPREDVRRLLAGAVGERLAVGELVLDRELVRSLFGLAPDAAVPLAAEQALLERWGHDLVVVPFSHGWGASGQPDTADALFRLGYWREHSALFVFALVDGPFSAAVRAWGWEETLLRFGRQDAELPVFLADVVLDLSEQLATIAAAGADGIIVGDDIAYRRGPYVRPDILARFYFPYLHLLVRAAQDLGLPVVFHSDGNLWPIWNELMRLPLAGIQGLDPMSAMSLALARQRSHPRLCLWGNLDLGWLTQPRDADAIRRHLHELLDPVAGTPVILGTCGGLMPGLPAATLDTLYAVARSWPWPARTGRAARP